MKFRCSPLCKHFHTLNCPKESDLNFFTQVGEQPLEENCFEKIKRRKLRIDFFELADTILIEIPIKTDRKTNIMYRFNGKIWIDDVKDIVNEILLETMQEHYKPFYLITLMQILKEITLDNLNEPPLNLICLRNGILNIENNKLILHSKSYFFRNMIDVNYNPNAKCEKFLKWLKNVLNEEDQKIFQEMLGYCFYRDNPFQKVFFLIDEKRTIVKLLEKLFKESITFDSQKLNGKLINIISKKKIEENSYTKTIVLSDEIPKEYQEKAIVIEFKNSLNEFDEFDEEELSGIFNWALEGLKRVLQNGFTKKESLKKYINPIQYFIEKYCDFEKNSWIESGVLYKKYKEVCEKEGLRKVSRKIFSREISKIPNIKKKITCISIFTGVKLKEQ